MTHGEDFDAELDGQCSCDWTQEEVAEWAAAQREKAAKDALVLSLAEKEAVGQEFWKDAAQTLREGLLHPRENASGSRNGTGPRLEFNADATNALSSPREHKPVTHSGYVSKKSYAPLSGWIRWQRRFLSLKENELQYFHDQAHLKPRKVFWITSDTTIEYQENEGKNHAPIYCVKLQNLKCGKEGLRDLYFKCTDSRASKAWQSALEKAAREFQNYKDENTIAKESNSQYNELTRSSKSKKGGR